MYFVTNCAIMLRVSLVFLLFLVFGCGDKCDDPSPCFDQPFQEPIYKGCSTFPMDESAYECGNLAMLNVFFEAIDYPPEARELGIEGTVEVEFEIDISGVMSNYRTVNDTLGYGLEQEAIDAAKALEELGFYPAYEDCVPVDYIFSLPVTFKLN